MLFCAYAPGDTSGLFNSSFDASPSRREAERALDEEEAEAYRNRFVLNRLQRTARKRLTAVSAATLYVSL